MCLWRDPPGAPHPHGDSTHHRPLPAGRCIECVISTAAWERKREAASGPSAQRHACRRMGGICAPFRVPRLAARTPRTHSMRYFRCKCSSTNWSGGRRNGLPKKAVGLRNVLYSGLSISGQWPAHGAACQHATVRSQRTIPPPNNGIEKIGGKGGGPWSAPMAVGCDRWIKSRTTVSPGTTRHFTVLSQLLGLSTCRLLTLVRLVMGNVPPGTGPSTTAYHRPLAKAQRSTPHQSMRPKQLEGQKNK